MVEAKERGERPISAAAEIQGVSVDDETVTEFPGHRVGESVFSEQVGTPFRAGILTEFTDSWEEITSDQWIISTTQGCTIDFTENPCQKFLPRPILFSENEKTIISNEIDCLLHKEVIEECESSRDQFISNIFITEKKDGTYRIILNLKELNKIIEYHHFKMDSLKTAVNLVTKNCFLASVDLKDAYYSVPIHWNYRKYLRFEWNGKLYQYTCFPNGLAPAPRIFTKLLKPVFSSLRKAGHLIVGYMDDCFITGEDFSECKKAVEETVCLFKKLGFTINWDKSVLTPCHKLKFLGFNIDSINMSISLTEEKMLKIQEVCHHILLKNKISIRKLAEVVGMMVASFPGVQFAQLYYRRLDNEKSEALKKAAGNFDAVMEISAEAQADLAWWCSNINSPVPIVRPQPSAMVRTDASMAGWGCDFQGNTTGGNWTQDDEQHHINYLELKAAFLSLKSFRTDVLNKHVRLELDNTTAIAYINNFGGKKTKLNNLARSLWLWCRENNIWISATHIPGIVNVVADRESRRSHDNTEWMLDDDVFDSISSQFGAPELDLFASHLNYRLKPFVSWKPDPEAMAIDAFSINWGTQYFYAFPPFSMLGRVVQKMITEEARGILIAPLWTTQAWFSLLLRHIVAQPVILPPPQDILTLPTNMLNVRYPLPKVKLFACQLSGKASDAEAFRSRHRKLFCGRGETQHKNNTLRTSGVGVTFAVKGTWIHFLDL